MADSTKTFTSPSSPPKEAKSGILLNYLKDPVFGSPEYDIPQAPSLDTVVTKEEFQIFESSGGINFTANTETISTDQDKAFDKFINISIPISKPDVGGTAVKAAQVTGEIVTIAGGATLDILNEVGIDLEKMLKGKTSPPKEKTPEDQQKEIANRQNTSVVQRAVQEATQISELNHQKHIRDLEGDAAFFSDEQKNKIEHLQANFKKKPTFLDARSIREAMTEQKRKEEMQKPSPFNKGGKGTLSSQRANQNEAPEGGGALATVTRGPQ